MIMIINHIFTASLQHREMYMYLEMCVCLSCKVGNIDNMKFKDIPARGIHMDIIIMVTL